MENSKPKLIILKTVQEKLTLVGISPKLVTQSYPFDWKMLMTFLEIGVGLSFVGMYVSKYAETFIDYTQSVFLGAAGSLVVFILMVLVLKVKKLFEFFNRCNSIINTSK